MSIGKMNRRLHFQTQTRTSDGAGSSSVSYSDSFTTFGMITPKSGNEKLFGDQLEENITHIIKIRYRTDVSHKNRIQFRPDSNTTRTFNVKRVFNTNDRNRYLNIQCVEGVAT
jgi:SPP1 family predicted phage head-tail adaptor